MRDGSTAVLDGCDGFLLGAETARGPHPIAAVTEAIKLCQEAERCFDYQGHFEHMKVGSFVSGSEHACLEKLIGKSHFLPAQKWQGFSV